MIEQNNNLIDTHPYQSYPLSWPLMKRGVNYWTDLVNKNQIYMTGNVAGWWGGLACIFIFCTIVIFDMGLRKRGTQLFRESKLLKKSGILKIYSNKKIKRLEQD